MARSKKYRPLGKRLLAARERVNLTADAVAETIGNFTAGSLRRYERGELMPGGELLLKLARLYGVSTYYLLTGRDSAA